MRINVALVPADGSSQIVVPIHYNRLVQGLIYAQLAKDLPTVHQSGWQAGSRVFRMFVLSRLMAQIEDIRDGRICFRPPAAFAVASPKPELIQTLAAGLLKTDDLRLGSLPVRLGNISAGTPAELGPAPILCRAIAPITVYSTVTMADGRKKTYYYHPKEKEFGELIVNNLHKKARALGFAEAVLKGVEIAPVRVRAKDQKIVYYGQTVTKGWMGTYRLSGHPQMLQLALDAGVGAKNSQGFGMLETIS